MIVSSTNVIGPTMTGFAFDPTGTTGFLFAGLYNFCIGATAQEIAARNAQFLCGDRGTLERPDKILPGLASVNVDGDPNNDRLPLNSSFITGDPDTSYATGNNYSKLSTFGYGATINFDLADAVALKSITAYRELHWSTGMDLDSTPMEMLGLSFEMNQRQFSEELQLLVEQTRNSHAASLRVAEPAAPSGRPSTHVSLRLPRSVSRHPAAPPHRDAWRRETRWSSRTTPHPPSRPIR